MLTAIDGSHPTLSTCDAESFSWAAAGSSFAETVTRLRIGPHGRSVSTRISIVTVVLTPASSDARAQTIVNAARPSVEPTAEQLPPSIFGRRLMGSTWGGRRSVTLT